MKRKITKNEVDKLSDGTTIWDTEVKGFGVRCRKGAKHYMIKLTTHGRQRWIKIGRHGSPWTPDSARTEAQRLLGVKASGKDPAATRDRDKGTVTVQQLGERFLDEHAKHKKTAKEYRRYVEGFITPELGNLKITDVTRVDVGNLHRSLRRTPYQANRVIAVMSAMFNCADDWGLWDENKPNPCRRATKRNKEPARKRYMTDEERKRLGQALRDLEGKESPFLIAAIKLLALTGARKNEILKMRWEWVDVESRVIRLPDSKTGAKDILLSSEAITVLQQVPRIEGNPYVIVGNEGTHLVAVHKPWNRIKQVAKLTNLRLHDLRHSFASVGVSHLQMGLPMVGGLMGHTQAATTQRYAHLMNAPALAAADQIASRIAAAMTPK